MYIPFEELSNQAYIWVYQANRQIAFLEKDTILEQAKIFLESWSSHGRSLRAAASIRHDHFLLLGIEKDDFELTCCTTDKAIHFLQALKKTVGIDFLNRNIVILQEEYKYTATSVEEAKTKLQNSVFSNNLFTFDNTIKNKQDLENNWLIPVNKSWFAK